MIHPSILVDVSIECVSSIETSWIGIFFNSTDNRNARPRQGEQTIQTVWMDEETTCRTCCLMAKGSIDLRRL